jgi:hypothetical protein
MQRVFDRNQSDLAQADIRCLSDQAASPTQLEVDAGLPDRSIDTKIGNEINAHASRQGLSLGTPNVIMS